MPWSEYGPSFVPETHSAKTPAQEIQVCKMIEGSGLYYKTIMIVIMTIISDASNCGVTYDRN
jgi:hypothetical protein